MPLLIALAATVNPTASDQKLSRMADMYERICLEAFPNDERVESMMKEMHARELTPAEVKITMNDDPARGWDLEDKTVSVWIEFPPYHACSVRWSSPSIGDFSSYNSIINRYKINKSEFNKIIPLVGDAGPIHITITSEERTVDGKYKEALMFVEQHISDPARRAAGETGFVLRFVHQFSEVRQTSKQSDSD